ncbi:Transposase (plasmid) [Mycetohabitans rhizoxinica HKI 454]|uniref:Transposase n=1 Tax=Mycetohabitans rhizoxinica (strain DSM 19002 / CIP 109453 / HKI 454) TaxID=882378 RepID=E5AWD1_MYCRK|nr:Transposase [Mycetohabitans rhizoxinica HKI 454]
MLEDANLKLGSVLTDVLGGSGRAILKAIISGEDDPVLLAALAQGHARKKTNKLREALRGRITFHHRTMLALHLQLIEALEHALTDLDAAWGLALTPIRQHVQLLRTIPGVGDLTARVLVAKIGIDMTRFADSAHLISWVGLCPRNDESW